MNLKPARSYLYVPGHRSDMLSRAADRGSDAVVADLEDAVASESKDSARETVASWLRSYDPAAPQAWVRVNSTEKLRHADLEAVLPSSRAAGVMVPKATADSVAQVSDALPPGFAVIPLVESARGVLEMVAIAEVAGVIRMGLGEADLVADLGMDPSPQGGELASIRVQLVVASAAAGIESPIAPVSTNLDDLIDLERSTVELRRIGFGARTAIHPAQVPVINRAFTPDAAEVERARRILQRADEAAAKGAAAYVDEDGRFVDEAVLRAARRYVTLAEEHGTR